MKKEIREMVKVDFEMWMSEVDKKLWVKAYTLLYDLPKGPLRDWYDDDMSPGIAANKIIKAAG